jgi:WD40 repeat protein
MTAPGDQPLSDFPTQPPANGSGNPPSEAVTLATGAPPPCSEVGALPPTLARDLAGLQAQPEAAGPTPLNVAVPGYEILGTLGRGGMGVVYQARQTKLGRLVALKMILSGAHADEADLGRFRTEAEAIARLQHPNIVQIHEIGEHGGLPFFSLEFCAGGSLEKKLSGTPLPPQEAAALVEMLARAMQAAHEKGVIHRDLKPANVLLAEDGTPKITDFGLAKKLDEAGQTASGAVMGTPSYMAPEQAGGKSTTIGPLCDVYALGAILYECLTGRPPFKAATTLDTLLQVMSDEPVPPTQLQPKTPRDLETICLKCLHKEPAKRYPSAAALADDLRRFQNGEAITARPVGRLERAGKWVRRNRAISSAAAGVTVTLVAGLIVSTYFGLVATAEANRADQEARTARDEAERAQQQERFAEEHREKADRAQQEQKRLSAAALRENARHEARADDPGAALPLLALAHRIHPDPHHDVQVAGLLALLPRPVLFGRHSQGVNHLAVSPDGARIVSGANDGTVRLWDVASGTAVGEPAHFPGPVYAVAFSADGSEFAAGGGTYLLPGKLSRFATADGRRLADLPELPGTPIYVGYTADGRLITGEVTFGGGLADLVTGKFGKLVYVLRLHDQGEKKLPPGHEMDAWGEPSVRTLTRVIAAGRARVLVHDGKASRVLDLGTRRPVGGFEHVGPRSFGGLSEDGRYAVVIGTDATAHVWNLDRGDTHTVPLGHYWQPLAAAVDERGQLAVAFYDGRVQRYMLADGKLVPQSDGKMGEAGWEPRFSADGVYLIAGRSGMVQVWRTDDRQPICPPLRHAASVTAFRELALGRRLAVGAADGSIRVWDLATDQRPVFRIETNFPARTDMEVRPAESVDLRFLSDGRIALTGGGRRWVVAPEQIQGHRSHSYATAIDPAVIATAVTPDGNRVFSATNTGELRVSGDAPPPGVGPLKHDNKLVHLVAPSADGRFVATTDVAGMKPPAVFLGNCQVWDATSGQRVFGPMKSSLTAGGISAAAVHADPGRVAVARGYLKEGGIRSQVQIYDLATGGLSGSALPTGPQMAAGGVAFSPNGRHLAVLAQMIPSGGGEVAVWDVATGHSVVPAVRVSEPPREGDFSPDSRRLAVTIGNRVLLFDLTADHPPAELAHPKEVQFARFGPGGSLLVTASFDQVFLWDPVTRRLIHPPLQHDRNVWVVSAAVSPDGRHAAAIANNGALMGWQIAGDRLDPDATARLIRLLTCTAVGQGDLVPTGADQLEDDWSTLRRTHPDEFRTAADVAADWHTSQFNATVSVRRFGAAGRHLEATWPTESGNDWNRLNTGACYLAAGDRDGVRRTFAELARITETDPTPMHLTRAVEIGLHDPEILTPAERTRAISLGDKLPKPPGDRDAYFVLARALALTRAGRLEEAEGEVALVQKVDVKIVQVRANAQLAVIRRLQGRTDEAKKLADKAAVELARLESGRLTDDWMSAIFLRRLVEEARRPKP